MNNIINQFMKRGYEPDDHFKPNLDKLISKYSGMLKRGGQYYHIFEVSVKPRCFRFEFNLQSL